MGSGRQIGRRRAARTGAVVASVLLAGSVLAACIPPNPGGPTTTLGPVAATASVQVDPCDARLIVAADAEPSTVVQGTAASVTADVRNEPTGACSDTPTGVVLSGEIELTGGTGGSAITDVAVWLRSGTTVWPSGGGLTSSGSAVPAACPGGELSGCSSAAQGSYGNVNYPDGRDQSVGQGETIAVSFAYFPQLNAADAAVLASAGAELVVALTTDDGIVVARSEIASAGAPDVQSYQLTVSAGGQVVAQIDGGSLLSGTEATFDPAATVGTDANTPDSLEISVSADGTTTSGQSVSASDIARVGVVADPAPRPELPVSVTPDAVSSGVATPLLVVARPAAAPDSIAVRTVADGSFTDSPMLDDGTGGDAVSGDGVYSVTVAITAQENLAVEVSASINGSVVTGGEVVEVLPAGTPTGPTAHPDGPTIVDGSNGQEYRSDRVILRMDSEATSTDASAAAAAVGGTIVGRLSAGVWQVAIAPLGSFDDWPAVAATLSSQPHVIGVDLDALVSTDDVEPDDPELGEQWWLNRIEAPETWTFERGERRAVTVAIVDTGVDLDHEDLDDRLVAGTDTGEGDDNPEDTDGHGTHVAGIVGAETNNGRGVAGVSWGARLMPVKVFPDGADRRASHGDIAAGIRWAVDHGAQVINLSLGGDNRSEDIVRELEEAWLANVVVVAAAGNDSTDDMHYPSGYGRNERFTSWLGTFPRTYITDVISVGSTNRSDNRSDFSNFGDTVDIAAPGNDIFSTYLDGNYESLSGTSMATPVVAGAAALVLADDPGTFTELVRDRLTSTAEDIGDEEIGRRVDLWQAVFNGGFESSVLWGWDHEGDARSVRRLGSVEPVEGERMGLLGTGPDSASVRASLTKVIRVDPDLIEGDEVTISFRYNYLSEEYPEWVGSAYNDIFTSVVETVGGEELEVATEQVNTTEWTPISGLDFPGGDDTVGQSGWKFVSIDVPKAELDGSGAFRFTIQDVGDAIYDSVVLIDRIHVR